MSAQCERSSNSNLAAKNAWASEEASELLRTVRCGGIAFGGGGITGQLLTSKVCLPRSGTTGAAVSSTSASDVTDRNCLCNKRILRLIPNVLTRRRRLKPRKKWLIPPRQLTLLNLGQLLLRLDPSAAQIQTVWVVLIVLRVFCMGCQNTDEIRQELKTGRAIPSLEASARPLLLSNLVEPICSHRRSSEPDLERSLSSIHSRTRARSTPNTSG